jgi:hypothetical protein
MLKAGGERAGSIGPGKSMRARHVSTGSCRVRIFAFALAQRWSDALCVLLFAWMGMPGLSFAKLGCISVYVLYSRPSPVSRRDRVSVFQRGGYRPAARVQRLARN